MSQLLFDAPWWFPAAFIAAGIALFVYANRRQDQKLVQLAVLAMVVGVGIGALSYFVDTDLEVAVKKTKQLVRSVEARDWVTMKAILDPSATLSVVAAGRVYSNRDQIAAGAQAAVERFGVKNIRILSTNAKQENALITINMNAISEHDVTMGRPMPTSWQFEWQRNGKVWSLVGITNLSIGELKGEQAADRFPKKSP